MKLFASAFGSQTISCISPSAFDFDGAVHCVLNKQWPNKENGGRVSGSRSLTPDLSEKTGEEIQDLMLANLTVEDSGGSITRTGSKRPAQNPKGRRQPAREVLRAVRQTPPPSAGRQTPQQIPPPAVNSPLPRQTTLARKRDEAAMAADEVSEDEASEEDTYLDTAVGILLTNVNDAQEDIRNLQDAVRDAANDADGQRLRKEDVNNRLDDHTDRIQGLETEASMSKERWVALAEGFESYKRNSKIRRTTANKAAERLAALEGRLVALEASLQMERSLRQAAEEKIAALESEAKRAKERTNNQINNLGNAFNWIKGEFRKKFPKEASK
ncbi:MAG: hypothetical protein Q9193_001718 [Seirophora villosa]